MACTCLSLLLFSCKEDDTPTCSDGIQNGNETGVDCGGDCAPCATNAQYFFEMDMDGESVRMKSQSYQTHWSSGYDIGGWVSKSALSFNESIGIAFHFQDSIGSLDLEAELKNKNIYFQASAGHPVYVSMSRLVPTDVWYSVSDLGSQYSVNVTDVEFVEFNPIMGHEIYAISGTYTTQMEDGVGMVIEDATGSFRVQCGYVR